MIDDEQIITISQACKMLGMSKANFVDMLNDDSTMRLITSYEDQVREYIKRYGYRGSKDIEFFTISMLYNEDLYIYGVDWKNFTKDKFYSSLAKLENKSIGILQNENRTLKNELADRQTEITKLKEKLAAYEEGGQKPQDQETTLTDFFDTYRIIHKIYELHNDGKDMDEIVTILTGGNEKLATAVLTGWLLQPDLSIRSVAAIKQRMNRIKVKKQK